MSKIKKQYSHESKKLNVLVGQNVKIKLWDNSTTLGILRKGKDAVLGYYGIEHFWFRKSHIKKVERIVGQCDIAYKGDK